MADIRAATMTTLTPRQQGVLDAIRDYWRNAGIPPTLKEIARHAGISSTSVVSANLDALEAMGRIRRTPGIARSIVLCESRVPKDIAATILSALKFDREEWGVTNDNIKAEKWVKGE